MSAESLSNITELRLAAKETKRFQDQKHKWAYGDRPLQGRRVEEGAEDEKTRPMKPVSRLVTRQFRNDTQANINKMAAGARKSFRDDVATEMMHPSDSSADEDVREASAAPEPDAAIAYSYDAPRGPGQGSQILSMALAQAVEKFETKETEKLVRTEYEVVGKESESGDGYTADDDDFELI